MAGSKLVWLLYADPLVSGGPSAGDVRCQPYARDMARKNDSPTAPRVSAPDLPSTLVPAHPARRAQLTAAQLSLAGDVDLAYADLDQCTFSADADSIDLTGATLVDVEATDVRATTLVLRNANLRRVRISGGRIGTLDLSGTHVSELTLRDLRVEYLTFGGARLHDVLIEDCRLRALDMPQAEIARLAFERSDADEVDTGGMRASDLDLRGLDAAAYLDTNSLRGTTMSLLQVERLATAFARTAGIQVLL